METKVIGAFVIIGILAIAVVGLVSAQITSPTPTPNLLGPDQAQPKESFWINRCPQNREEQCRKQDPLWLDQSITTESNTCVDNIKTTKVTAGMGVKREDAIHRSFFCLS